MNDHMEPGAAGRTTVRSPLSNESAGPSGITDQEAEQVKRANKDGNQPVVFVHGLWLLPNTWDHWADLFEKSAL